VTKYREVHRDPFRTIISAADECLRTAQALVCLGYGFNDEHVQPVLMKRVRSDRIPLVLLTKSLTKKARDLFLTSAPEKFLFLEALGTSTRVYSSSHPTGMELPNEALWMLKLFLDLVTGRKAHENVHI